MTAPSDLGALVRKMEAARAYALDVQPHAAPVVLGFEWVWTDDPALPTLAVDPRLRFYWNTDFARSETIETLAFGFLHEAWHILNEHSARCPEHADDHERKLWNHAGDRESNDDLRDLAKSHRARGLLNVPDWVLQPEQIGMDAGLTAEKYFDRELKDEEEKEKEKKEKGGPGGEGQEGKDGGQGEQGQEGKEGQGQPGSGSGGSAGEPKPGQGGGKVGKGECGSGATGKESPGEAAAKTQAEREGRLPAGKNPGEVRKAIEDSATIAENEAQRGMGGGLGSSKHWVDIVRDGPRVNFGSRLRSAMRGAIAEAGRGEFTYAIPSRRQSAYGNVIAAGMEDPQPNVFIVLDSSGSMGARMIGMGLAVVEDVLKQINAPLWAVTFDGATRPKRIKNIRELQTVSGWGGSDAGPGLELAKQIKPPPVTIVITDCETAWPEKVSVAGKVIIVAVPSSPPEYIAKARALPYADVIVMEGSAKRH